MVADLALARQLTCQTTPLPGRNQRQRRQVDISIYVIDRLNSVVEKIEKRRRDRYRHRERENRRDQNIAKPLRADWFLRKTTIGRDRDLIGSITISYRKLALPLQQRVQNLRLLVSSSCVIASRSIWSRVCWVVVAFCCSYERRRRFSRETAAS